MTYNKEWDCTKESVYERVENLQGEVDKLKQENEYLNGLRGELLYYKGLNNLVESHNMMEESKKENKQLYRALDNLVNLKIHKETFGKTEYYEEYKELAWDEAKVLIGLKEE